jgi:hypothetical protein
MNSDDTFLRNFLTIYAAQKNNELAAQNYEFSCPNLRQPIFYDTEKPSRITLEM